MAGSRLMLVRMSVVEYVYTVDGRDDLDWVCAFAIDEAAKGRSPEHVEVEVVEEIKSIKRIRELGDDPDMEPFGFTEGRTCRDIVDHMNRSEEDQSAEALDSGPDT